MPGLPAPPNYLGRLQEYTSQALGSPELYLVMPRGPCGTEELTRAGDMQGLCLNPCTISQPCGIFED